ncbi:MAG: hypothetical protein WDN69_19120 [Aliidongia sp.]
MDSPIYTRRLSDKILWAFDQAIEQKATQVAGILMQALELALTREGGPGKDRPAQGSGIRLRRLRQAAQGRCTLIARALPAARTRWPGHVPCP